LISFNKFLSQRKRTIAFACYYERTNGDSQLARGKHNKIIRTDISSLMRLQRATLISSSKPNNATPKVSACEMQHELRNIQSEQSDYPMETKKVHGDAHSTCTKQVLNKQANRYTNKLSLQTFYWLTKKLNQPQAHKGPLNIKANVYFSPA